MLLGSVVRRPCVSGLNCSKRKRLVAACESLERRWLLAAHIVGSTTVYSTIQAAVDAAATGATVTVDAGSYAEQVNVWKTLTIQGAQAGVDARLNTRLAGPSAESVVTGVSTTSGITDAFYINANDVTLDGFTVQGETSPSTATGAGIVIAPNRAGTHIVNNIIQNNVAGVFLSNNSGTDAAVFQHNVFRNNNNNGPNGGRGIYTDGGITGGSLTNVTIDGNFFYKNRGAGSTTGLEAAVAFEAGTAGSQSNVRITNNVFDDNGKAVLFFNTTGIVIQGNQVTNTLDQYSGSLRFEGNNHNVTIQYNNVYDNTGPGVAVDSKGVPGNSSGFVVTHNNFYGNSYAYGNKLSVVVEGDVYDGPFDATNNWWGSASGPGGDGAGTGDTVYGQGHIVTGANWYTAPGGTETFSPWATAYATPPQGPYWGTPSLVGAPVQAEDFDHGGNGVAYSSTASNRNGPYRPGEGIPLESTADTGGGYDVKNAFAGQWLAYTLTLPQVGTYQADFRLASTLGGGTFHLTIDGVNATGPVLVPATGAAQAWRTVSVPGLSLTGGNHVVRLVLDTNGADGTVASFNWLKLTLTSLPSTPAAPTGLTATVANSNTVNLAWVETSTNQTGFKIQRATGTGGTWVQIGTAAATATTYTDTTAVPGTGYSYRVVATNAAGDSAPSNVIAVTTPVLPTTYVSDLSWVSATVGWGTIQKDLSIVGNPIRLRGVTYSKGIGTHAVSQIVYNLGGLYGSFVSDVGVDDEVIGKGTGSVDFQVIGDGKVLFDSGVVTNNSPTVSINVSVAGVQQLTLVANNGVAGIDYDHADWAGARLLAPSAVVAAPSNLRATAVSTSQINLTWTDNAPAVETGFLLERSSDGIHFSQIASLAHGVTSYADVSLSSGTTYTYRVRATSATGTSAYSSPASATTTAVAAPTFLSDLAWTSATIGWGTIHKDQSVMGNPITLHGVVYAKGIGTHAASQIVYALGGKYTQFTSAVGIDDEEAGRSGAVDFQVIGDGKILFDSGVLTSSSATVNISLNITGIQQLTLVANPGIAGVIDYDHADWAGAKVV